MQKGITRSLPLLNEQGDLTQAGYATKLLPVYDRAKVKGGRTRMKEWDYYYVGNDRFGVALTVADNSYMGLDSISFLSFEGTPWQITKSPMRAFPMGRTALLRPGVRPVLPGGERPEGAHRPHGQIPQSGGHRRLPDPHCRAGGLHGHLHPLRQARALLLQPEDQLYAGQRHCRAGRRPLRFPPGGLLRPAGLGTGGVDL